MADPTSGRRISVGTYRTKAAAESAFSAALTDQHRGAWVAPADGRITLDEFSPTWLASRLTSGGEPLRPRVRDLYEGYLRLHILPVLGSVPLSRLTTGTIRQWHAGMLASDVGASTSAKCYRLLRAILNTAVEDHHLVANPCSIKGAGVEPSEERMIPTIAQVYALADAVSPRYRALVLLAAFGGLRRGELFALERADIDLLHRTSMSVRSARSRAAANNWSVRRKPSPGGGRLRCPTSWCPNSRSIWPAGWRPHRMGPCSWASRAPRSELVCGTRSGNGPAVQSACRTSIFTICGMWPGRWPRRRERGPKRSCAAWVTPLRRPRFDTSTPPTSATACLRRASTS
jgi:hypothetical protein